VFDPISYNVAIRATDKLFKMENPIRMGVDRWRVYYGNLEMLPESVNSLHPRTIRMRATGDLVSSHRIISNDRIAYDEGDIIYAKASFFCEKHVRPRVSLEGDSIVSDSVSSEEWTTLSGTITTNTSGESRIVINPSFSNWGGAEFLEEGDYELLSGVMALNLTKLFGRGREPSTEDVDDLVAILGDNGWFEGKIVPAQKDVVGWLVRMIQSNRSAILSIGGGP